MTSLAEKLKLMTAKTVWHWLIAGRWGSLCASGRGKPRWQHPCAVARKEPGAASTLSEVNSVQTQWQQEPIPTYLLFYMASQASCSVSLLADSMSILLWGATTCLCKCYGSYFAFRQQKSVQGFL